MLVQLQAAAPERLEDAHMEHIMNAGTFRKLEPICHLANAFQDLERTSVLGAQLAGAARCNRLVVAEQPEQHPVTHSQFERSVLGVVEAACVFLGLEKTSTNLCQKLIPVS
jgi:hypothetical protein